MKVLLLILLLLLSPARADAQPVLDAADGVSAEGLSSVESLLPGFSFRDAVESFSEGKNEGILQALFRGIGSFLFGEARASLKTPLLVAAAAVLSSFLGHLSTEKGAGELGFFLVYATCIGLATAAVTDSAEMALRFSEDMATFTGAAMPALSVLAVSSGGGVSPALLSSGAVVSMLLTRIGIPSLYISLSLSVVGNLSGIKPLRMLSAVCRRVSLWLVCGGLTIFSAVLGVTGYAAGTLGGAAAKGVKFAAQSLIPVLGGLLSDSAEAVSLTAVTVKNAAGSAAMLFLLLLTLYPVLKTMLFSLLYRLAGALASVSPDNRIASTLSDMADMLSALAGMTAGAGAVAIIALGMLLRFSDMGVYF